MVMNLQDTFSSAYHWVDFLLCLSLVQPRKHLVMTEKVLTGTKSINTNKIETDGLIKGTYIISFVSDETTHSCTADKDI